MDCHLTHTKPSCKINMELLTMDLFWKLFIKTSAIAFMA